MHACALRVVPPSVAPYTGDNCVLRHRGKAYLHTRHNTICDARAPRAVILRATALSPTRVTTMCVTPRRCGSPLDGKRTFISHRGITPPDDSEPPSLYLRRTARVEVPTRAFSRIRQDSSAAITGRTSLYPRDTYAVCAA